MHRSPRSVRALAVVLLAAAVIAGLTAFTLLRPGSAVDALWKLKPAAHEGFAQAPHVSGAVLAVLGFLSAAAAFGLLAGRRWAQRLTFCLFFANALGDAVRFIAGGEGRVDAALGILLAAAFLLLTSTGAVRRYCRR